MADFPRTKVEDVSVSRMIVGTNWFLGYSHTSKAKDDFIKCHQTREKLRDILTVFMKAGVDTVMGIRPDAPQLNAAIKDAEQITGRKCITIGTPGFDLATTPEKLAETEAYIAKFKEIGSTFCMPHQCVTDALTDKKSRRVEGMDRYCKMIRKHGMIPGLSSHTPEALVYADETDLDVATYIQIYNAAGFLMPIEVDWIQKMIWNRKRPVMTIKPLAAGRLMPLVGLAFVWSTLRPIDMVTVGCMTPDEAQECIEISLSVLNQTGPTVELQRTRSKASVEDKKK